MATIEWVAFCVLLVSAVAAGAAITLSNGAVTRAIRAMEHTYRRQKSLELELLQAQEIARRRTGLELVLTRGVWRQVLRQVLADALGADSVDTSAWTLIDLSAVPSQFVVGQDERGDRFIFTTAPDRVQHRGFLGFGGDRVIPLDAGVSRTVGVEVEAVWKHLAGERGLETRASALPRQASWSLVLKAGKALGRGLPRPRR